MMLPEDYMAKCLQIATEALKKIADTQSTEGYLRDIRGGNAEIAQQALNEMRKLPASLELQDFATRMNSLTHEQIATAMESMPTEALEWGVKFEALSLQKSQTEDVPE